MRNKILNIKNNTTKIKFLGASKHLEPVMQIYIKNSSRKAITLYVVQSDTIMNIKQQIQNKDGIPTNQQKLLFYEKQLEDVNTLADYKIQNLSILNLALLPYS